MLRENGSRENVEVIMEEEEEGKESEGKGREEYKFA